jgi:hypothetical protein
MTNAPKLQVGRFLVAAVAVWVATSSAVRAEVGVAGFQQGPAPRLQIYQLASINDNPDPFGMWIDFSGSQPGRIVLNPEGAANGDGPPSIVSIPALGLNVVAWSRNSPNGFDIVMSRFDGTGWTAPQVIVGVPGVDELDPALIAAADGTLHLFYWVSGPSPQVFYTSAPAGTATFGESEGWARGKRWRLNGRRF